MNLSNNQLSELPPLWETIWGSADPATGLLILTATSVISDSGTGGAADKEKGKIKEGSKGAKVLLLGNPLLTSVE